MPSDDAPFIIESDDELPTGRGKGMRMTLRGTIMGSKVEAVWAHMKTPSMTCQSFTTATGHTSSMAFYIPELLGQRVHTEILFKDGGILEIYHLDREATETR